MEAMPIRIPTSQDDVLKDVADPHIQSDHVEYAKPPAVASGEHLPSGISETEGEKKSHWFIGSIDCGTTSSRFLIFDCEGNPVASHQIEFENMYPESG
jgi:glycerol kinase